MAYDNPSQSMQPDQSILATAVSLSGVAAAIVENRQGREPSGANSVSLLVKRPMASVRGVPERSRGGAVMQSKAVIVIGTLLAMSTAAIAQTARETPQPLPQPMPEATAPAPEAAPSGPAAGVIAEQSSGQSLGSELIGADVLDATGEQVGDIEDVILDEANQLVGVVVATGGFLGIGKRSVGVELDMLKPSTEPVGYVISLSRAELEAAPPFMTVAAIEAQREAEILQQQQMQQQAQPPISTPAPVPQQ
jgi:hypothetical protein